MTDRQILVWIKKELGKSIREALEIKKPSRLIDENVMAGICFREVGNLLHKYVAAKTNFDGICSLMKGDLSQRTGETERKYHGFSFWQIDVNTDAEFINSGEWKNPLKACKKAIEILQGKINFFAANYSGAELLRIALASYNCGEGNVKKAIKKGYSITENKSNVYNDLKPKDKQDFDIDIYTHQKNYSKEVLRYIEMYKGIQL